MKLEKKQEQGVELYDFLERKGDPAAEDEDTSDVMFDVADAFDNREFDKSEDELWNWWKEHGQTNPSSLFHGEQLKQLKQFSGQDRLRILSYAAGHLTVTPEHMRMYVQQFPEDLIALQILFEWSNGRPDTSAKHMLFTLGIPLMVERNPSLARKSSVSQYVEIAERRQRAPGALLEQYPPDNRTHLSEFGAASDACLAVFSTAEDLQVHGYEPIDTSPLFGDGYQALSDTDKAEFLRTVLAEVHSTLVFHETFNSVFTKDRVTDDAVRMRNREYSRMYNVAHSMLFKTYQPMGAYEQAQERFEYDMSSTSDIGGDVEEYAYPKILLAVLAELRNVPVDSDKTVDVLVEFWTKNRNPIFANAVTDALSALDPNRAATRLLEYLRSETEDRTALSAMLYRLEFGKVGISGDGVRYLEKLYDLGEYNNPDFFAKRLTANGQIGIFDEKRVLQTFFELGDLSNSEVQIKATMLDFTLEQFFSKPGTEGTHERLQQESILRQFKEEYFTFFDNSFFEQTNIQFNNLGFKEQAWFMRFALTAPPNDQERALAVAKQFGEDGLRTFMSLEFGEHTSDVIFTIAEQADAQTAERIFRTYANMIHSAERAADMVQINFAQQPLEGKDVDSVVHGFLKKAQGVLVRFAQRLEQNTSTENSSTVIAELDTLHADTLLFADILRALPRDAVAELDLREVPAIEKIIDVPGPEIAKDTALVQQLTNIIRKQFPDGDDIVFMQEVLGDSNIRLTVTRINGEVISFFTTKEIGPNVETIDWFISNPDSVVRGLGEATVSLAFDTEVAATDFYAVAKPHVKSFPISVNSLGFVAFAGSTDDGEYKHHYVRLCRLAEDAELVTKSLDESDLLALRTMSTEGCHEANVSQTLLFKGAVVRACKVEFSGTTNHDDDVTESDADGWIMGEIARQYQNGYVLTRFLPEKDTKQNVTYFAIFEPDPNRDRREKLLKIVHETPDQTIGATG